MSDSVISPLADLWENWRGYSHSGEICTPKFLFFLQKVSHKTVKKIRGLGVQTSYNYVVYTEFYTPKFLLVFRLKLKRQDSV